MSGTPINAGKLLSYPIPEVRQTISGRDAALYALSVGLGQDPLDERQLRYVCADRNDFEVLPSFALVAAHPGFWLADPESGVDHRHVLHASQSLKIRAPFQVNETVISRSKISRLVDKGEGKAALLDTQTRIETESGQLVAELERTTFVRGGGGFGGENPSSETPAKIPDTPAAHIVHLPTRPEHALYYRLNGDSNPLHSDPKIARAAGFEAPILHGLCTAGIVYHALLRAFADYDARRLSSLEMRFSGFVRPGETVSTHIWPDGSFRAVVKERDAVAIDNGRCTATNL